LRVFEKLRFQDRRLYDFLLCFLARRLLLLLLLDIRERNGWNNGLSAAGR